MATAFTTCLLPGNGVAPAIDRVLDEGWCTKDIADATTHVDRIVGSGSTGDLVVARMQA